MGETPRRILVADMRPTSRAVLEPLIRDEGWEMLSVDSSFRVLRTVRDANVDLVLINPDLPGSGVSGSDVAKTLKGATQFRHLPVLFLLDGKQPAPAGIAADGSIALDQEDPTRILHAMKQALGLVDAGRTDTRPEPPSPPAGSAGTTLPPPETLLRPLTDLIERLTARLESHLSRLLDEHETRSREEAGRRVAAAAQEWFAGEGPRAIRQEISDQVRGAVERAVREVAREVVPEVAERLIAEELARLRHQYDVE